MKKFHKMLCLILAAMLLVTLIAGALVVGASGASAAYGLADLLGAGRIKALGRTQVNKAATGITTDWSGSGFEINMNTAGGTVTVGYKSNYASYWVALVDGQQVWRGLAAASTGGSSFSFQVASGEHTVSVVKETQIDSSESGYYYLTNLTFDGTILAAPAEKDMYIEFVGDSYSAGDGALGVYTPGQRWEAQDDSATHSFGWYVARELDADYSIVARGGIGLFDGTSEQEGWTRQHTMADIYSYTSGYNQGNGVYGFARQPDIVVVELGANDGIKTDDAYKTIDAWAEKMEAFVGQVRAKNPDAAIVCLHHQSDKYYVSRRLAEKYDNVYAFYHAHNGNGSAALATQIEGHPSWEDHEDIAKALVNFFTYNDLLPQASTEQTNDITYYVSANGSDSNNGKTLATAKLTLPAVLTQAKADNSFAAGDRVVIYAQGTVVGTTTQSFGGGEESQLRTTDGKNVPVVITTYDYDTAGMAELQVNFLPTADGAASMYARNDFTFKDIAVKSYTSTQGYCIYNFYSAGCDVTFDNALLTTDGKATNTAHHKWNVGTAHFSYGGSILTAPTQDLYSTVTFRNGDYTNLGVVAAVHRSSVYTPDGTAYSLPYLHSKLVIEDGAVMGTVYGLYGTLQVGSATVEINGGTVAKYEGSAQGTYKNGLTTKISGGVLYGFRGLGSNATVTGDVHNIITGGEIQVSPTANTENIYLAGGDNVTVNGNVSNTISGGAVHITTETAGIACEIVFGGRNNTAINGNLTNTISGGSFAILKGAATAGACGIYFGSQSGTVTGTLTNAVKAGTFSANGGFIYFGGKNAATAISKIVNVVGAEDDPGNGPRLNANVYLGGNWGQIGTDTYTKSLPTACSDTVVISNTIYGGYFGSVTYGGNNNKTNTANGNYAFIKGSIENNIHGGFFMNAFYGGPEQNTVYGKVTTNIYGGHFTRIRGAAYTGVVQDGVTLNIEAMEDLYVCAPTAGYNIIAGPNAGTVTAKTAGRPAVELIINPASNDDLVLETPITMTTGGSITGTTKATVYGGTYTSGFSIGGKAIQEVLAEGKACVDTSGNVIDLTAGQSSTSGKTTVDDGEYSILQQGNITHCLCGANSGEKHIGGCDGTVLTWTPWSSPSSLPTTAGNYYLTAPVTLTANQRYENGGTINLDLNGQTVYTFAGNARGMTFYDASSADITMTITDASKGHGGKMICQHTGGYNGALIYMYNSKNAVTSGMHYSKLSIYRVDMSAPSVTNSGDGGTIRVDAGHTLNLYGVTLEGCTTNQGSALFNANNGTINIADGSVITGLKANSQGGAIYNGGGTLNIIDSTVTGGSAVTGGAILVSGGTVTVKKSTVNGSAVTGSGSAVYMFSGTLNLESSTVTGKSAATNGGAIAMGNGTLKLKSTTVTGASAKYGGALAVLGGTATMEGGKLVGVDVTQNGTAVYLKPTATASFTMSGDAIIDGTGTTAGNTCGAVYVDGYSAKATFTMNGGQILGGIAKSAGGGAVCVQDTSGNARGFFVMNGGTITGGVSNSQTDGHGGGSVRVTTGGNFTMNGGVITGGTDNGTRKAGGVMVTGTGTMTIGGSARIYGNNGSDLYLNNRVLTIADGWSGNGESTMVVAMADYTAAFASMADATEDHSVHFTVGKSGSAEARDGKLYGTGFFVNEGGTNVLVSNLSSALVNVAADSYIQLLGDINENVTVAETVMLDLNGHSINGNVTVASGAVLKLFDSATADYTAQGRGRILGTVTGELARTMNTPAATYGHNYKYLTIREADGSYSAHRIFLSVKSTLLKPYMRGEDYTGTAVHYKTVFKCNDVVAQYVTAYGSRLSGDNAVYTDYLADGTYTLLTGSANDNAKVTQLAGTMRTTNTTAQNAANAEIAPEICAYIRLNDGLTKEVTSAKVSKALKEVIAGANMATGLNDMQELALARMYEAFEDVMDGWTDIHLERIQLLYRKLIAKDLPQADKVIALTFDDGPSHDETMQQVLDVLDMYDTKATFFLIGTQITDSKKQIVLDAYNAGHELGNHTYSHQRLPDLTQEEMLTQYSKVQETVEAITGQAPRFLRPPFLAVNQTMRENIPASFILSSTDGNDWSSGATAESVSKKVLAGVSDGGIILLHVTKGYTWTVEALHTIIPELIDQGYEITTVSGLFEAKGVEPENGVSYTTVG